MLVVNDVMDAGFLRRFKGFIFDCDGVLIDSYDSNIVYYNKYRAHFGLPPMGPEEEAYTHTHSVLDSLRRIVPEGRYEEALELRSRFDYRELLPHLRREPGVRSLLAWMRSGGFALGVHTNRTDTMGLVLPAMDLEGFFNPVMTAGNVAQAKPHPEGVHTILSAWGLGPAEVAFLGDSSVDEETARNAGVAFWAYKNEALSADLHVPGFRTLQRALSRAWPEFPVLL